MRRNGVLCVMTKLALIATVLCFIPVSWAFATDIDEFNEVIKLYNEGKFDEALGAANRFIAKYPKSPLLPNALYTAGRLSRDVATALDLFSRVVVKYPGSSVVDNALFMIAQYHYAAGSFDKALLRFRFIVENYKTSDISDAAHWWLARSHYAVGDTVMAQIVEGKLAQKYPSSEYAKMVRSEGSAVSSSETQLFTVQVGSFGNKESATALSGSLAKKGYDAYVTMSESSGKILYRVRLGSFLSREEALQMVKTLKDVEGLHAWVTSKN